MFNEWLVLRSRHTAM